MSKEKAFLSITFSRHMEKLLHNQYSPRVQMTMRRAKIGKKSGGDQPAGESAAMETTPIGHTQRATQRPVRNGRH